GADRDQAASCRALVGERSEVAPAWIVEAELALREAPPGGRVTVHHGTVATPARIVDRGHGRWQIRARDALLARAGDRVVVRASSPPDTLGGGTIVEPRARRAAPPAPAPPAPERDEPAAPQPLSPAAVALEQRLREAGHEPPPEADLDPGALRELRAAGRAVRVGRAMYAHPDAIAGVRRRVEEILGTDGEITLARLRDELQTSRKFAQALLEHLDAARVTRRLPDDRRVARRQPTSGD
ncbi:MAG TPA: SelB C-terminal domain-containing protein, partial [Capillimicrobium sp.]